MGMPGKNNRIRELVAKFSNGNVSEFARNIGIVQQRLDRLFKIDSRTNKFPRVPEDVIEAIKNKYSDVNLIWLETGTGEMLGENAKSENAYLEERRKLKTEPTPTTLEYYEIGASAGTETTGEILPVPKRERRLVISELFKGSQFAIRIAGNSMMPNYPPGAIIGIRLVPDKIITPGSVYVIEKANDLWIKRVFYKDDKQDGEYFELVSDNTMKIEAGPRAGKLAYPSFCIKIVDVTKLFKVTGIFKHNELSIMEA